MSGYNNRDRNNRDSGNRSYGGGSRGGWGEPRPTGLASSLPAASSGRTSDAPSSAGNTEDAMWSRTAARRPEPSTKADDSSSWRNASARPVESSSFGSSAPPSDGPRGWGGPRRRDEPIIDDVDDKFARSFAKMSGPSTSAPVPTRNFDEPPRRNNPYDEPPRRSGFGGGRDRNLDAEVNATDDKYARAFGGSKRDDSGNNDRRGGFNDYPRREGGDSFGGRSNDVRNRRREEDDGEWQSDPRFANKFGGGGGRRGGDRDDRRDDRGGFRGGRGAPAREYDPNRFDGPLPSAPKAAVAAASNPARAEEEAKALEAAKQSKEDEAKRAREEKEAAKAARKKAEEDAKRAKEEAKRAEEEAKNAVLNAYSNTFNTTTEAIKNGQKGSALTAHLKANLPAPILPAGVLKAILSSLNNDYTSVNWWGADAYGDALKNLFEHTVPAQVSLLYAVQDFCHSKKFPKITTAKGEKRLIEALFNILLNAKLVDIDGIIAWADDDNKLNIAGRTDAIVQTTAMVQTLRDLMADDEEEEEEDLDDYQQQYIR